MTTIFYRKKSEKSEKKMVFILGLDGDLTEDKEKCLFRGGPKAFREGPKACLI